MFAPLFKIVPTILIFALGYLLKKLGIFNHNDGSKLLKLVFYVTAPALILLSLTEVSLDASLSLFPIAVILVSILSYFLAVYAARKFTFSRKQEGVFIMASMFVNSGFVLPFVIASLGNEGIVRASLFDVANAIVVYGWGYTIAVRYGKGSGNIKVLRKLSTSPALWAVIAGLLLNFTYLHIPTVLIPMAEGLGSMTGPLIMLALGLLFTPSLLNIKPALTALTLRMGVGLTLGLALIYLFNISGVDKNALLLLMAAPIGFNTITFAALENLDEEFAASIVSIGLIAGLIVIPLLTLL